MIARHSHTRLRSLPQTPRFSYTAVLYLMQEVSQFSSQWSILRLHSPLNAHETSDTTCMHRVSWKRADFVICSEKCEQWLRRNCRFRKLVNTCSFHVNLRAVDFNFTSESQDVWQQFIFRYKNLALIYFCLVIKFNNKALLRQIFINCIKSYTKKSLRYSYSNSTTR